MFKSAHEVHSAGCFRSRSLYSGQLAALLWLWRSNLFGRHSRLPLRQLRAFFKPCRATTSSPSQRFWEERRNSPPQASQAKIRWSANCSSKKYQEMHRSRREADGSVVLYIGAENWPFPIPVVNDNGSWRFDPDAGQKEVLFRRIGESELAALATCQEFTAAEKQYRAGSNSDPADSSPASLVAKAASGSASSDPVLLDGYYFRLLPRGAAKGKTPGSVLIAHPAKYRSTGVITFVVSENGTVYEKDLGANTSTVASTMPAFYKDGTWRADR